ncbi:MAG: acyl-CoA thioesterase [Saprospiraceae bacterium]|nr:acyl-CoA thioesterase [Saprospiraceae bacterium]
MTEMIMPNDTNPLGNLMGGNLMRWMDIAGGICAAKHCASNVVTASVDHVSFSSAIRVGDVITLKAYPTRAFTTSLEVYVEVYAANMIGGNERQSNHAYLSFVALDNETKKPCKVPPLRPVSSEEQKRFDGASRRRELRLILSGRLKPGDATEIKDFFANT